MPVSPYQRAQQEGLNQPEGGSGGESGTGKSRSHPTSKRRAKRQKTKEKYAKAREDAQLEDVIPTTPEGAVRDERVPPSKQSEGARGAVQTATMVSGAVRNGWAVPKEAQERVIDELVAIVGDPEMPAKAKVAAANALRLADKDQWERDHPETAARVRGNTSTTVNVVNNVGEVFADIRRDIELIEGTNSGQGHTGSERIERGTDQRASGAEREGTNGAAGTDREGVGDVQADGAAKQVDETQANGTEEARETD